MIRADAEPGGSLPVQVRDLPAMRVAALAFTGPPADLGKTLQVVHRFAVEQDIGPCGPSMAFFARLAEHRPGARPEDLPPIQAEVLVPITRLVEGGDVPTRRLSRGRAACLIYSGPLSAAFREHHLELFAWMDSQSFPRAGTAHQHAYLSGGGPDGIWTVEIRVPIVGGRSPGLAI